MITEAPIHMTRVRGAIRLLPRHGQVHELMFPVCESALGAVAARAQGPCLAYLTLGVGRRPTRAPRQPCSTCTHTSHTHPRLLCHMLHHGSTYRPACPCRQVACSDLYTVACCSSKCSPVVISSIPVCLLRVVSCLSMILIVHVHTHVSCI
jgi:hypothetical protein